MQKGKIIAITIRILGSIFLIAEIHKDLHSIWLTITLILFAITNEIQNGLIKKLLLVSAILVKRMK